MAASNFMNALSNLGSFGLNFASGTSVSKTNAINTYISNLWRKNYEWSNKNGYSFMREGLEKADYNPLLAIGASPQQGFAPSAVASGDSFGLNADIASGKQANVARDMAGSQIQLNQANALKAVEEGLTQSNYRSNLDADTSLKNVTSYRIWKLLPYEIKEKIANTIALNTQARLNTATAQYVPYNAESQRMSSTAHGISSVANTDNALNNRISTIVRNPIKATYAYWLNKKLK